MGANRLIAAVATTFAICVPPALAQEPCLKEVFNRYCLGGPIATVLESGAPDFNQERGPLTYYGFKDGAEMSLVSVFDGKIATVSRPFKPSTMVTFSGVRGQLVKLYGQPKRDAMLPDYTRGDMSAIENAINVGRARVQDTWQQEGWRVALTWTNRGIMLLYSHDGLREARSAVDPNPSGF